jgi:hypothetical protein
MAQDLNEYCVGHNLLVLIYWVILWEAKRLCATKYPEVVNKLIIADIGPKFYPTPSNYSSGIKCILLKKPSRSDVETILEEPTLELVNFNESLYWQEPGQLAFRFNLASLIKTR